MSEGENSDLLGSYDDLRSPSRVLPQSPVGLRTAGEVSSDINAYGAILDVYFLLHRSVKVALSRSRINSPDAYINLIQPLKRQIRKALAEHSASLLYACLYVRGVYQLLAMRKSRKADVLVTRANIAETLAIYCVKEMYSQKNKEVLKLAFCTRFVPFSNCGYKSVSNTPMSGYSSQFERLTRRVTGEIGSDDSNNNSDMSRSNTDEVPSSVSLSVPTSGVSVKNDDPQHQPPPLPAMQIPNKLDRPTLPLRLTKALTNLHRIMAKENSPEHTLEVAARTEAKRFTAQDPVHLMVQQLWKGRIRWKDYDIFQRIKRQGHVHGHDYNEEDEDLINDNSDTAATFNSFHGSEISYVMPAGAHFTSLEIWLAQTLRPLRIPAFQCNVGTVHFAMFLALYFTVISNLTSTAMSWSECLFCVLGFAYLFDELRQLRENGMIVYKKNIWNGVDVIMYTIFVVYFALRMKSIYTGSEADASRAFDILALDGIILWPRLFAVLDQYEFFGTLVIQLKYMLQSTGLFIVILVVVSLGFFQTFWALSLRYSHSKSWADVGGMMVRIFFGNSYEGFSMTKEFGGTIGTVVMGMYIGTSVLVLYNILIGVINQAYARILDNAREEFRFAMIFKVLELITAHTTYPFVPPFNIMQICILAPLKRLPISTRMFVLIRSLVLLIIYSPHLIIFAILRYVRHELLGIGGPNEYIYEEDEFSPTYIESEQSSCMDDSTDDDTPTQSQPTALPSHSLPTAQQEYLARYGKDIDPNSLQSSSRVRQDLNPGGGNSSDKIPWYKKFDEQENRHKSRLISGPNHRLVSVPTKSSLSGNNSKEEEEEESPEKLIFSPFNLFSSSKPKDKKTSEHSHSPPFSVDKSHKYETDTLDKLDTISGELQDLQVHQTLLDEKYNQLNNKLDTIIMHLSSRP